MTRDEVLAELAKIDIIEIVVPESGWIGNLPDGSERTGRIKMLADLGSPNSPDFTRHDSIQLIDAIDRAEFMTSDSIHSFKMMRKIEERFGGRWRPFDGGSTNDYDEWVE